MITISTTTLAVVACLAIAACSSVAFCVGAWWAMLPFADSVEKLRARADRSE